VRDVVAHKVQDHQEQFPPNVWAAVRNFSQVDASLSLAALAFDWLWIGGAITLSLWASNIYVYALSVIMIGARQHGLLIIVHEGVHYRLCRTRLFNDIVSDVFAALPIFFCTYGYRIHHLAHHGHLNTEKDPDWSRKANLRDWTFPQRPRMLAVTFMRVALSSWYKMAQLFWTMSGLGRRSTWVEPAQRRVLARKIVFYGALASVLTIFSGWSFFLFYWMIPYLIVMPLVERVRSVSEHFGLQYNHPFTQSRDVLSTPVESFFFGPHNIRYHMVHHLFPTVPQYNLPKLHEVLMGMEGYRNHAHQNDGYFLGSKTVLSDITKQKEFT